MHTLTRRQVFSSPPASVFAFFQNPEHLALITPPWLDLRIVTPPPLTMGKGALIDYTIRWLGVPVRWRTLITVYDPPSTFVDEQIKGPYSLWHHTHSFVERDDGTEMTDEVRYMMPFGPLGVLAHHLLVKNQLEEIFDFRAAVIGKMFMARKQSEGIRA